MPKACPVEFRNDVVAVARKGESTLVQIAKDFGIDPPCVPPRGRHIGTHGQRAVPGAAPIKTSIGQDAPAPGHAYAGGCEPGMSA